MIGTIFGYALAYLASGGQSLEEIPPAGQPEITRKTGLIVPPIETIPFIDSPLVFVKELTPNTTITRTQTQTIVQQTIKVPTTPVEIVNIAPQTVPMIKVSGVTGGTPLVYNAPVTKTNPSQTAITINKGAIVK